MVSQSFTTRLRDEFIASSALYRSLLMEHEYLVCSKAFRRRPYYIFYATRDNFLHLTGVHSTLKSSQFFEKCLYGTLTESDFSFSSPYLSIHDVIGCAKKKSKALLLLDKLFSQGAVAEEDYRKGHVRADFALAAEGLTLCFTAPDRARPKSILGGNCIRNGEKVDLILRRGRGDELFDEIVLGDRRALADYSSVLEGKLANELLLNAC